MVGSQAILGTYDESQLPDAATCRGRAVGRPHRRCRRRALAFEELRGFSIDGVDLQTAVLPDGWRDRLVKVQNANTATPPGEPRFTGLCLDKDDLCVAKLVASRDKDRNFVAALLKANPCRRRPHR